MTIDKFADDWNYLKFQPPLCNHALLLPRDWLYADERINNQPHC